MAALRVTRGAAFVYGGLRGATPLVAVLRWAISIWLGGLLLGISGLAIYAALMWEPKKETPWSGILLHHTGQGLLLLTLLTIVIGLATVIARGVWLALSLP